MDSKDWRTIDQDNYTFAVNGRPAVTAERFLELGTYNAIISPNSYYSPENSDFASSHKTFKRMMPTFAWEVVEVYSGPPRVAFKWVSTNYLSRFLLISYCDTLNGNTVVPDSSYHQ